MKKVCIFDFDGTLLNTVVDAAICYNKALEIHGFKTHPIEQYGSFFGGNIDTIVKRILEGNENVTQEDRNKIKHAYIELYLNSTKENTVPYEGIMELLENLQSNGVKLAINTNKRQVLVDELCEKHFPNIKFERIIGNIENYPSKPDPQAVYDILECCNEEKDKAVYIGDGKTDIKTAANAGIDMIFVEWGQGTEEDKKMDTINHVVSTADEIFKIVMQK